ncbi:hypothetical protein H2248_006853 [Termitomyces sp. 'cryptogamus']|nr:hypothetical protein H2248_006853 [Termitomyces sp. 'cryptogamus']
MKRGRCWSLERVAFLPLSPLIVPCSAKVIRYSFTMAQLPSDLASSSSGTKSSRSPKFRIQSFRSGFDIFKASQSSRKNIRGTTPDSLHSMGHSLNNVTSRNEISIQCSNNEVEDLNMSNPQSSQEFRESVLSISPQQHDGPHGFPRRANIATPKSVYTPREIPRDNYREIFIDQLERQAEVKRLVEHRKKRLVEYSNPSLKVPSSLSWPLLSYEDRRASADPRPMLFFDISRDPLEGLILQWEDDQKSENTGEDYSVDMQLPFSPNTPFKMVKLRCEHEVLKRWEVVVERSSGIRVIDIFTAIYNAYHVPLNAYEITVVYEQYRSPECVRAFHRRCELFPDLRDATFQRGMCRIDLLGDKTLFHGVTYDDDLGQYCFQLVDKDHR